MGKWYRCIIFVVIVLCSYNCSVGSLKMVHGEGKKKGNKKELKKQIKEDNYFKDQPLVIALYELYKEKPKDQKYKELKYKWSYSKGGKKGILHFFSSVGLE